MNRDTEGAKFWPGCLTDLKSRGLEDIFVVCVDGLSEFPDVIQAVYPTTKVQLCIVHLVRAALKYVIDKDRRAVINWTAPLSPWNAANTSPKRKRVDLSQVIHSLALRAGIASNVALSS